VPLHLLGTGNPISIAIYSINGADSFDGLEWCQLIIDHETSLLLHLSQYDFVKMQTSYESSEVGEEFKAILHNLEFYKIWIDRLRTAISTNTEKDFCRIHFPERFYNLCANEFKW
jgi:queuine/archaeosine tRNA-ribosyltransferase